MKWLSLGIIVLFISSSLTIDNISRGENDEDSASQSTNSATFYLDEYEKTVQTSLSFHDGIYSNSFQPSVIIDSPGNGATFYVRNITVHGFAYASSSECRLYYWEDTWTWKGGSITNSSYFEPVDVVEFWIHIHGLSLGWNNILVTFYDNCGMYGSAQITVYYEDIAAPEVAITYPSDESIFTEQYVEVEGYIDDHWGSGITQLEWVKTLEYGQEGDFETYDIPLNKLTFSIPITLSSGKNFITVVAIDAANNSGYYTVEVTCEVKDEQPPTVTITTPLDESVVYDPSIHVVGLASDNIGVDFMEYVHESLGETLNDSWQIDPPMTYYPFDLAFNLTLGENVITIGVRDEDGNYGYASITITYAVDTTPPEIDIVCPKERFLYVADHEMAPFPFTLIIGGIGVDVFAYDEESGIERVEFYVDDELKYTDFEEPYEWFCYETMFGSHTFGAKAYDYYNFMTDDYIDVLIGQAVNEAIIKALTRVEITDKDGNVITEKQVVCVGQKITLGTKIIFPPGAAGNNFQWTVPDIIVKDYTADATKGVVDANVDKTKKSTQFYWVDGADGRSVTVSCNVNGIPCTDTVTFDVKRPTAEIITKTGEIEISTKQGPLMLHFGTPTAIGITFKYTITFPTGCTGTTQWVQLSYPTRTVIYNDQTAQIYYGGGLDGTYPYSTCNPTNDNPGTALTNQFYQVKAHDSYEMFLMFKPSGTNSIWVPLREVEWSWGADATRSEAKWTIDAGTAHHTKDPQDTDSTKHPEWTHNIKNNKWKCIPP